MQESTLLPFHEHHQLSEGRQSSRHLGIFSHIASLKNITQTALIFASSVDLPLSFLSLTTTTCLSKGDSF
ncbi:MAG TPA: hypothetical protein VF099_03215, partial [Ktedonobacterales bacterium]